MTRWVCRCLGVVVPEALLLAVHGDLRAPLDIDLIVLLLVRVPSHPSKVGRPVCVSMSLGVNLLRLELVEVVGGELGALGVVLLDGQVGLGLVPLHHDLRAIVSADGIHLVGVVSQALLLPRDLSCRAAAPLQLQDGPQPRRKVRDE